VAAEIDLTAVLLVPSESGREAAPAASNGVAAMTKNARKMPRKSPGPVPRIDNPIAMANGAISKIPDRAARDAEVS
jgi:hypothetical protein